MRKYSRILSIVVALSLLLINLLAIKPVFAVYKKDTGSTTAKVKISFEDRVVTEIIVKYKDTNKKSTIKKKLKDELKLSKLETKKQLGKGKIDVLEVGNDSDINSIIERLKKDPNVEYAQPNYKLAINTTPFDHRFIEQWALKNDGQEIEGMPGRIGVDINAVNAWDITKGSQQVAVGLLDTGVDINHNDLAGNIYVNSREIPDNNIDDDGNGYIDDVNGWDFANGDNTVYDSDEKDLHGTYVAGIIAAKQNTQGISGIAPNIKIMPLKFINSHSGYTCDAIEAIEYAMSMKISIINCSFGGTDNNLALKDAIQNSGILFVAAAGNRGGDIYDLPVYPAGFDLPNIISVAAIDNYGVLAPFSTYGNKIHVAAPGVNILSTTPDNTYGYFNGTSVAAPYVTGIAALIKSHESGISIGQIKDRIKNNVVECTSLEGKVSTSGRVDAYAALVNIKPQADAYDGPGADITTIPVSNQGGEMDTWYTMDQLSKIKEKLHYGESGVSPASGNFSFKATDMSIPAPGFEVNISRTYNSRDDKSGSMGRGWSFGFEGSAKGNDLVTVLLPNGSIQRFRRNGSEYTAEDSRSIFVKNPDNTYTLTTKDQYTYGFNQNGWLIWMRDRNGNAVNIVVDANGKVQKITDTVNREYIVSYNTNGLISSVKDPENRIVRYEYDASSRLIKAIDSTGAIMRYSYDSYGFINKIEDHYLKRVQTLTYDHAVGSNQHKVVQTIDSYGNINNYTYNTEERKTTIKDQNSRVWSYWFDKDMYTIKVQDAEGKFSFTEYFITGGLNKYGDIKSQTDRNGNCTKYEIDTMGNITKLTNPDLSTKEFGYDQKNNKIYEKDELGRYTFYIYDTNGLKLLRKVRPLNGTDQYIQEAEQEKFAIEAYLYYTKQEAQELFNCNADGLLKSIINPEGSITEYTYDAHGNTKTIKDPENNITAITYNQIGWKIAETSPNNHVTTYNYNTNGQVEKAVQNGGETTRILYDMEGRKVKEISPNQYCVEADDIINRSYAGDYGYRYEYYDSGKLKKTIDAENYETTYTYDTYGNVITETKPNGAVYRYEYDVMDRVVKAYFKETASAQEILLEEYAHTILTDGKTQKTHKQYLNNTETAVTAYIYDYANRLTEQQNSDGSKLKYSYNANGTLSASTAENGSISCYKYDGLNRLTEKYIPFEISNGQVLYTYTAYEYDKAGNKLIEKTSSQKVSLNEIPISFITTSYTYYKNGLLKSFALEGRKTEYLYDKQGNVLKEEKLADANTRLVTEYTYNHTNKPTEKKVHISSGSLVGNQFDDETDTILKTTYEYDKNGNLISVTAPNDVAASYTYDNSNRQITMSQLGKDEFGTQITITISTVYNWEGKPVSKTDANGNTTIYEYNKRGMLIKAIDALSGVTAYSYDLAGRKIAEISPLNYNEAKAFSQMNRAEYVYDTMSRLKTKKDIYFDANTSQWNTIYSKNYKYDISGNVVLEQDALGYDDGYGTRYAYNLANVIVTTIDPIAQERELAYTKSYKYDALSRKISEANANGVITLYTYDANNNILEVKVKKNETAPEQVISKAAYDLLGRQISKTDGNNNTTYYEYNALGKVSKAIYPGDETIPHNTVTYQYDMAGNLAKEQNTIGRTTIYEYDNQARLVSVTNQKNDGTESITVTSKYDKNGNKRFETDGNGNIKEYVYDKLNRVAASKVTVKGAEQITTYSYDDNNNQTAITDWKGNTTTNIYDALNRLIEKRDSYTTVQKLEYNKNNVQIKSYDAMNNMTEYQYDRNNRLISTIDAMKHKTSQTYDNAGNINTKTSGRNITTKYSYDEFNRLIAVINPKLEITSYTYDLNGNVLTQTNGNGHVTSYEYNSRNKMTKRIDHGGRLGLTSKYTYIDAKVERYVYNADGTILSSKDRNGIITSYQYDIHGRLTSKTAGQATISYTYDKNNNQLTVSDSTGTTTRTYDELSRTTTKTVPHIGISTYVYDIIEGIEEGYTKETTTDPKGNIVEKIYDKAGRLSTVISADGTTSYEYYPNGNRKSVVYPSGVKEEYTYNADNQLITLVNKKADGSIMESYSYTYDADHNQISKTDAKGTTNYTYDSLNRLQAVTEPLGKQTAYTFDKAGNRLTETVVQNQSTTTTSYTYNEQNRLLNTLTTKPGGESEKIVYDYDNNGNMISKNKSYLKPTDPQMLSSFTVFLAGEGNYNGVSFYEYNVWNQLVNTIEGSKTISYGYNAEGYRVEKNINGQISRYLYEADKVILEVDAAGNQAAANVYGINLISRKIDNDTAYYLYNGHADVVGLINSIGDTIATYYYDAFGNATEATGTANNPYRYSGYRYDEETDIYYLNARYYDAKIARFMTEDTYRGQANDPLSLNLYTYCHNDPIMYKDPTGHWEEGDELLTPSAQAKIKAYTDMYFKVESKILKDYWHKKAESIRTDRDNYKKVGEIVTNIETNKKSTDEIAVVDTGIKLASLASNIEWGTGNAMSIDKQDELFLSERDYAAILALKYEYTRCQYESNSSGMDAAMRAIVQIRQSSGYKWKYHNVDVNGRYIDDYKYSSSDISTITDVTIKKVTNRNQWIEGTAGLSIASFASGFAPFPYGFIISKALWVSDPSNKDFKIFSGEGMKTIGKESIGDLSDIKSNGKPVVSEWVTKLYGALSLYEALMDPSIKVGDYKVIVTSTTNTGLDITQTTAYVRDKSTIFIYDPIKVSIEGRWRGQAKIDWREDVNKLLDGKLNLIIYK